MKRPLLMDPPGPPLAAPSADACDPHAPSAGLSWTTALGRRMGTLWLVKMLGTTLGIAGFFPAYFWVMHSGGAQALVMPLTPADRWFAMHEAALPVYASLWLFISLPCAFAVDKAALARYAAGAAVLTAVSLAFFWLVPTAVPALPVNWADYPSLQFLKSADAAGNAFPSLHVAFAVFACGVLAAQLRAVRAPVWVHAVNVLWGIGIVYSTLATGQHVIWDVVGGLVLGAAVCLGSCRTQPGFGQFAP